MTVSILFDAYIRASGISRNLRWEIRQALLRAADDDGAAAWEAVLAHNDGNTYDALRWLEDEDFIDFDRGGMGVRVRARVTGECDTCWTCLGVSTVTLPDGIEIRTTFDCCGWNIEPDDDDNEGYGEDSE